MSRGRKGRPAKTGVKPKTATMPPAISDDEMEDSDGVDVPDSIPARATKAVAEEEDDEEEDDDEEEPDEYRVEKIIKHDFGDEGVVLYQIKWLGYEKKGDLTWEPIENLENATDILEAYHTKIGGPPVQSPAPKKKGPKSGKRSASAAFADSPAVAASSKQRGRKSMNDAATTNGTSEAKKLPEGSWENHVRRIGSILEETDPEKIKIMKGKKGANGTVLLGLLEWSDRKKTQHPLSVLRSKCPQKLLDYYEQHLVFKHSNKEEEVDEVEE